jgi:hypothetical protein
MNDNFENWNDQDKKISTAGMKKRKDFTRVKKSHFIRRGKFGGVRSELTSASSYR